MEKTSADVLVERLLDWGVEVVFGLPGDGVNGIMEALRKQQERIRFIQVRHEEAAAFAAVGYAKFSGRLGVCLSTTGPGAIHMLNGLYDAKMDQIPVLAISGMPFHDLIGTFYQQDVDTAGLFKDVAVYSERVMGPAHVRTVTDHAIRSALTRRGVGHIAFPNDFQEKPAESDSVSMMNQIGQTQNPAHTSPECRPPVVVPTRADLVRAAEVLNAGQKVVALIGSGARGAHAEIEQLCETLGAPVAKALLGKDVLADDSVYSTGLTGVFGTNATSKAMQEADTIFLIGTSFPYISYLPDPAKVRGVQVDSNPERIGLRFPVEVGLCGDARATLTELLPLLKRNENREFLQQRQSEMAEWRRLMDERGTSQDMPMRPQVFAREIGLQLEPDAIICGDSGTNTLYAAREMSIRQGQRFSCSGLLASMGSGLTYAIGAQIAFPNRQVIAFVGDGGLTMTLGELATCAKHRLPIKIFVMKNNVLGMIRWEQMMFLGNPEYGVELENIDFAKVAEACGVRGYFVDKPENVRQVVTQAFQESGPVLVEAVTDPFEPLMPGNLRPQQAEKYAEALKRGEPNAGRIGLTLFRDALEDPEGNKQVIADAIEKMAPDLVPEQAPS